MSNLLCWVFILFSMRLLGVGSWPHTTQIYEDDQHERKVVEEEEENQTEVTTEDMGTAPPIETGEPIGPTLGDILSKFSLGKTQKLQIALNKSNSENKMTNEEKCIFWTFEKVVLIIYAVGIGYKLVKIHKGEYVREDPIYLKYK